MRLTMKGSHRRDGAAIHCIHHDRLATEQVFIRLAGMVQLSHTIPAHVFARSNASEVCHVIMRDVSLYSRTLAIPFAASDAYLRYETWQHTQGNHFHFP